MTPSTTPPAEDTPEALTCYDCDSPVGKTWLDHTFTHGMGDAAAELTVRVPVHVCPSCGLEFLDDEAQTLKHEAICAHLGVLSPNEVRGIRKGYGMSRAAFANVTGLGEATLNRWENGILIQSVANDRYLRLLAEPDNLGRLRRRDTGRTVSLQSRPADREAETPRFLVIRKSEYQGQQEGFRLRPAA